MEDTVPTKVGPVSVRVQVHTDFSASGNITLRVHPQEPASFRLALRVPAWAKDSSAEAAGRKHAGSPGQFLNLEREEKHGETVAFAKDLNERLMPGGASYPGHFAFLHGPPVLTLVAGNRVQLTWKGESLNAGGWRASNKCLSFSSVRRRNGWW
jgi:DUF1680 family protein